MGAWGAGNFENDSALDWLTGFDKKRSLARLKAPLEKGLTDTTGDDWDEALAAAEIISLIRGHPSKDCPEDLQIWAQQNQVHPEVALVDLARKFVAILIKHADTPVFRKSFRDTKEADAYLAGQKKLLKRLKFNFKKLPKTAGQAGSGKPRNEPWVFVGYVKITKGRSRSMSYKGERLPLPELPEVVKLEPRPGSHISLEMHLDFFFTPAEIEQLTRLIQRNGQHRIKLVRLSGGNYFKNKDLQAFLEKIAPHLEYLDLMVTGIELTPLLQARRMSKLSVFLNNKVKGSDLAYLRGMSDLEVLCVGLPNKLPTGDVFSGNKKLKFLSISTEEIEGNRLPELPESLEELHIGIRQANPELDLSSLTRLPKLRRLALSANHFKRLPIAGFESMEWFWINTAMEDVRFLRSAKNLRDLMLPPQVPDLGCIEGLNELRQLRIGGGYKRDLVITDLTPLKRLPKLRTLHLSHSTRINSLPELPHLERFEFYRLPQLKLVEIAKFPALRLVSTMSPDLSNGIDAQIKAILPRAEWVDHGFDWQEAEPSRYDTYFQ